MPVKNMKASLWVLSLSTIIFPGFSLAQYIPPRVEWEPLAKTDYSHIEADDIIVADCYALYRNIRNTQLEEMGTIRIAVYTPLPRTADHLAQERVGQRGANCLMLQTSSGLENASYPVQRTYKAFRLTALASGFGSLGSYYPAPYSTMASALPAASIPQNKTQVAAPKDNGSTAPAHEHLWTSGNFIYRYEIGMDTSKFSKTVWEDISNDFREYFPRSEYNNLLEAYRGRTRVLVDFKNIRIKNIQ